MQRSRSSCIAFAVSAMIGSLPYCGSLRSARIVWRPSISGIMKSISTRSISGCLLTASTASRPLRAISTFAPFGSSTLVNANTLRTSSSAIRIRRPSNAVSRERAAGVDDHRREAVVVAARHLLEQLEPRAIRQREVEHHAVERPRGQLLECGSGRAGGEDLDVATGEQPRGALAEQRIVLADQHAAQLLGELGLELLDRVDQLLALAWF